MTGNSSTLSTLQRNRSAYRGFLSRRTSVLTAAVCVVIVVAFTVGGSPAPGAVGIPPLLRLAYYALCAGIGSAVCYSSIVAALYLTRNRTPLHNTVAIAGAMLVAAVPCTAIAHGVQIHMFSVRTDLTELYFNVVAHGLPIALLVYYVAYQLASPPAPATVTPPEEAPHRDTGREQAGADAHIDQPPRGAVRSDQQARFFRRLAQRPDGDVVYLKTRGHYLDIYTTTGSCSALMRFADAIDDLDAIGLRVHRGYWVAHSHVTGLARHGQRRYLQLTDGSEIPISRTYLSAVQAAFPNLFGRNRSSRAQDSPAVDRPAAPAPASRTE